MGNCKFRIVIICSLHQKLRSHWTAEGNRDNCRNPTRPSFHGTVSVLLVFKEICLGFPQNLVCDAKCLTIRTNILTFLQWRKTSAGLAHPSATTNGREYVEVSDYRRCGETAKDAEESVSEMGVRTEKYSSYHFIFVYACHNISLETRAVVILIIYSASCTAR